MSSILGMQAPVAENRTASGDSEPSPAKRANTENEPTVQSMSVDVAEAKGPDGVCACENLQRNVNSHHSPHSPRREFTVSKRLARFGNMALNIYYMLFQSHTRTAALHLHPTLERGERNECASLIELNLFFFFFWKVMRPV